MYIDLELFVVYTSNNESSSNNDLKKVKRPSRVVPIEKLMTVSNVVKTYVEINNVILVLPSVVQISVEINNVDSTLLLVVNSNIDIINVVSALIRRCLRSRHHIKLRTTLKQHWKCLLVSLKRHFIDNCSLLVSLKLKMIVIIPDVFPLGFSSGFRSSHQKCSL